VVRLERLLSYLGDQVAAARRMVRRYQEARQGAVRPFRLPPLVPAALLSERIAKELARAETQQQPIGVFLWELSDVGEREAADDSLVPAWLQDLLRQGGGMLDALGRLRPGHWVGWMSRVDAARVKTILRNMQQAIPGALTDKVTVAAWSHPAEAFDLRRLGARETAAR